MMPSQLRTNEATFWKQLLPKTFSSITKSFRQTAQNLFSVESPTAPLPDRAVQFGPQTKTANLTKTPEALIDESGSLSGLIDGIAPRAGELRPIDENANLLTHGLGFVLSLIGSVFLLQLAEPGNFRVYAACVIYCSSLVGLYAASSLSHAFYDLRWRRYFRCLDQAFIFLLIAGSFTPFAAIYLNHGWWPLLTIAMWTFAIAGALLALWYRYLTPMAQMLYLLLGWLPAISLIRLVQIVPPPILVWILAGGVFYTVGTLFLYNDHRVRYLHALWHAFVIAGSTCHFVAILELVTQ